MSKTAETIHGKASAAPLDQDKVYQVVRTMVGDFGTVIRPSQSARMSAGVRPRGISSPRVRRPNYDLA
jgi:hypothetical protein